MAKIKLKGYLCGVEVEKIDKRVKKVKLYFETCEEYNITNEIVLTLSPREFSVIRACIRRAKRRGISVSDVKAGANKVVFTNEHVQDKIWENETCGKHSRKKGLFGGYY